MRLFWQRAKQQWLSHLLSVLQIAGAVMVVTSVFALALPIVRQAGSGPDDGLLIVRYGGRSPGGGLYWTSAFESEDARRLMDAVDSVVASVFDVKWQSLIRLGDRFAVVRRLAEVDASFFELAEIHMTAGSPFSSADQKRPQPAVAVLSEDMAATLFPGQDPIGQTINLRPDWELSRLQGFHPGLAIEEADPGFDVVVIGLFDPDHSNVPRGFDQSPEAEILVPVAWEKSLSVPEPRRSQLIIRPAPGRGQDAIAESRAYLESLVAARQREYVGSGREEHEILIESAQDLTGAVQGAVIIGVLGTAALFVAGIAVFTSTMASVARRTRRIGLQRALGATRLAVLREVVSEAALVAAVGGLLGVAASFPFRRALGAAFFFQENPPAADLVLSGLGGVVLAALVGALAAMYPGWTVARLQAAEAWREDRL